MMPAMRAVASTSPFLALPERISSSVAGLMMTRPSAIATRSVAGLSDTSTMQASPCASIWVRAGRSAIPAALAGGAGRAAVPRKQGTRCGSDVGLSHQALAYQEGLDVHARQSRQIGRSEDAALSDEQAVLRH